MQEEKIKLNNFYILIFLLSYTSTTHNVLQWIWAQLHFNVCSVMLQIESRVRLKFIMSTDVQQVKYNK